MRVKVLCGFIYKEPGKFDLFNPASNVKSKIDPSRQQAIKEVLEGKPHLGVEGGVPSISQSTTRSLLGYIQGTLELVFGNSRDQLNRRFLENSMLVLKARAAGMKDKEIYNTHACIRIVFFSKNLLSKMFKGTCTTSGVKILSRLFNSDGV